jgi:protein tyrosine/serine phosphatase
VPNFRDLGGYPCSSPQSALSPLSSSSTNSYITRSSIVFRSAQLTAITTAGLQTIFEQLKIRRFYDLRSEREASKDDPHSDDQVKRVPAPVFRDQDLGPEALAAKYRNYTDADEDYCHGYSAGFVRAYRDILLNGGRAFRTLFEHIRDRDLPAQESSPPPPPITTSPSNIQQRHPEPLLFNCAAGKDRTGVFAALVLRLCGVADEIIAWEYSITAAGLAPHMETIITHLMSSSNDYNKSNNKSNNNTDTDTNTNISNDVIRSSTTMTRAQAERVVDSRAKNMLVFLRDVLDGSEVGGVEKYMRDRCGLDGADVDAIRARLVVRGESPFGDGSGYWKASRGVAEGN